MNAETELELVEMLKKGAPPAEVAAELDVSLSSVYRIARMYKVTIPGARRSVLDTMTEEDRNSAIKAYEDGTSASEIIGIYGLNYNAWYKLLRERGVELAVIQAENEELHSARMEHAIELYTKGVFLWKIVSETGIAQPQLHAELHKRGIKLRRG